MEMMSRPPWATKLRASGSMFVKVASSAQLPRVMPKARVALVRPAFFWAALRVPGPQL